MVKIRMDTHEFDELLLDVLIQACGNQEGEFLIDNMCLSAYEDACSYLTERGYLKSKNGRIYILNKQNEVKPNSSQ